MSVLLIPKFPEFLIDERLLRSSRAQRWSALLDSIMYKGVVLVDLRINVTIPRWGDVGLECIAKRTVFGSDMLLSDHCMSPWLDVRAL